MSKPRKKYYMNETCKDMLKHIKERGFEDVVFNAVFYQGNKKMNSIERGHIIHFDKVMKTYMKTENPDKVKIEFWDNEKNALIWGNSYKIDQQPDIEIPANTNFQGLGELEVNDLVQRKYSELERKKKIESLSEELEKAKQEIEELQFELQDKQATLDAKKQIEYYSNIIGMALPGLAKLLTGTPVASAVNFLAGTDETPALEPSTTTKSSPTNQRESIIEMMKEFSEGLNNQELGTLYLLFIELEKDRDNIQRILTHITQIQTSNAN